MNNNDMNNVCVVQFLHPGGEHRPTKKQLKNGIQPFGWNFSDHKRKFMKVKGQYYIDQNNKSQDTDELYFWGEWEPWSNVQPVLTQNSQGDYPCYIHEPLYYRDSAKYPQPYGNETKHRQNTDPFVFADQFLYSLCQQNRKTGSTILQSLSEGSIILFGSCKFKSYFALDTVFVISERKTYSPMSYYKDLVGNIPQHYDKIMGFNDWPEPDKSQKLVSYKGASFNKQYKEMYSFVPCKVGVGGMNGFERVKLTQRELPCISDKLTQSFKVTPSSISKNIEIWEKIREVVREQGCLEGVRIFYSEV